jgi:hypothetical protein
MPGAAWQSDATSNTASRARREALRTGEGKPRFGMKLTSIAAAALIPSTLVGIACSVIVPFANGAPSATLTAHATARPAAHSVHTVSDPRHRSARHATTAAAAKAASTTTQPTASSQPVASGQAASSATTAPSSAASATATSSQSLTIGMSAFEQCVAWRESGNTPTDPDGLFGILPSTWAQLGYSGTAGQASVAQQEAAFNQLYAQYGAQPWAPSDGC